MSCEYDLKQLSKETLDHLSFGRSLVPYYADTHHTCPVCL